MKKPFLSYAVDKAILTIGNHRPERSHGGFGKFPKTFVALKTSIRITELGLATVERDGRIAKEPFLRLTPAGHEAYNKIIADHTDDLREALPELFEPDRRADAGADIVMTHSNIAGQ